MAFQRYKTSFQMSTWHRNLTIGRTTMAADPASFNFDEHIPGERCAVSVLITYCLLFFCLQSVALAQFELSHSRADALLPDHPRIHSPSHFGRPPVSIHTPPYRDSAGHTINRSRPKATNLFNLFRVAAPAPTSIPSYNFPASEVAYNTTEALRTEAMGLHRRGIYLLPGEWLPGCEHGRGPSEKIHDPRGLGRLGTARCGKHYLMPVVGTFPTPI